MTNVGSPIGVLIHDACQIPRETVAGRPEGHQNQVRFRNIWVQRLLLKPAESAG